MVDLRIHGDNIVECERTLDLVARALGITEAARLAPINSPVAPSVMVEVPTSGTRVKVTLLPGYSRWNRDILEMIALRGGKLREAADAIITRLQDGSEELLLGIEFCGALPAGNQAWQRNGRALSFAQAAVPYIYVAELGGHELGDARERRGARVPNPAVPFSYLLLTESKGSPALPVFVRSPGASEASIRSHLDYYGEQELLEIVRHVVLGESFAASATALRDKALGLVQHLSSTRSRRDGLAAEQWARALAYVREGGSLPDFLAQEPRIAWAKRTSIAALTGTARQLMGDVAKCARGLTSSSLPFCLVPRESRNDFADTVRATYPGVSPTFLTWCRRHKHLAICWVMGFKPGGEDARPDRGLPPFCRMLVGSSTDVLTVVYGPAPRPAWPQLASDPTGLMESNGLWQSVLMCSDALLVDASTLSSPPPLCYLRDHWDAGERQKMVPAFAVTPIPVRTGENDVDTVVHLLLGRLGLPYVFEGMCNPPGGDWSGVSILTEDQSHELRWLVLPRVTAPDAKRPDHVFQLFGGSQTSVLLAVESKERTSSVESGIGPRLRRYVEQLLSVVPSVQRVRGGDWTHYPSSTTTPVPPIATAVAALADDWDDLREVAARADVDLALGCSFPAEPEQCSLFLLCRTDLGRAVAGSITTISVGALRLRVEVQS